MSATSSIDAPPMPAPRPLSPAETRWSALRGSAQWRVRDVVWLSAASGLAAGWIESLYWCVKRFALHDFTYVHDDVYWMSPLAHLVLFLLVGLPLGWLVRRVGHPVAGMFAVVLLTMAAGLCALQLFPQVHQLAQLLLTLGAATQVARWCDRHPVYSRIAARRTAMGLSALALLLAAGQVGHRRYSEHRAVTALPVPQSPLPNVLLIVLDTVRADALGAYGAEGDSTPNLDRLAARGVLFEQAASTASWTLPATASLMTGRLPGDLSADWLTPLDSRPKTLAESLRDHGYLTGGMVANYKYATAETGLARGFSRYDSHSYSPAEFAACTAVGRLLFFSRVLPNYGCYGDPVRRSAREINDRYLDWADSHPDRPHFAFLNYLDAHDPYAAPAPFDTHRPQSQDERSLLRFWWFLERESLTADEATLARDAYADCVRYLDSEIGRLIDELEARGALDNTLIVVTADHGEHFGEHDLWLHGNSLYEPLVHVPLIVVAPQTAPEGRRVTAPVSTADVAATIHQLLGFPGADFPGRSLDPTWHGILETPRPVYAEVLTPPITPPCQGASPIFRGSMRSVRLGDLKLIRNEDGGEELFDLASDPDEAVNLAALPEHAATLQELRDMLNAR
ncbi:MAG: sulfatase [Planctomycetaceae bacterium]|nr:sulfatase [Planctomycetaceae bacterium]